MERSGAQLAAAFDAPFRAVAEMTPDAMMVADERGFVAYANPAAERLLGYGSGELDGRPLTALMPERFRAAHAEGLRQHLATGRTAMIGRTVEVEALRCDGGEVPVELTLAPAESAGRQWFAAIIRDVSERRDAQLALARSEGLLAQAARVAGLGCWEWSVEDDVVTWSDEMYRVYGLEPRSFAASFAAFIERVHPHDVEHVAQCIERAMTDVAAFEFEHRIVRPDGEVRTLMCRGDCATGADGRLERMFGVGQDITERMRMDHALREADERFRKVFEESPVGIVLLAEDGRFVQVNDAFCAMTGYREDELLERGFGDLTHPDDAELDSGLAAALFSGQLPSYQVEKRYVRRDGGLIWASLTASVAQVDGGAVYGIGIVENVTERKRFEGRLQYFADHDPLTGLFNRRRFEQELGRQVARAARYTPLGAVLLMDLDNFKYVNDTLGHRIGDELIRGVADVMRSRLRATDVLARLGGDEFAMVLPEAGADDARHVAETLRAAVAAYAMTVQGRTVRTTASIGVAPIDRRTTGPDRLIVEADLAMYAAKHAGRDRVTFYSPGGDDHSLIRSGFTWSARLREALEQDRFVLHAQPIVDVASGETTRYELLIRMLADDGSLVPPGTFLATAERFGLVEAIDRWVACQAIDMLAERPELTLEVNLSGKSIGSPELLAAIEERLRESGADARRLIFEVTETAAITNMDAAREFAQSLRRLGCKFALDDFGAGFGSFVYLKHLPVDYLKLDGDFIRDLTENKTDQLVVRAMVDVARGLGQQTIAEFVGSEECFELLRELGVDFAQGFWLGKPAPLPPAA